MCLESEWSPESELAQHFTQLNVSLNKSQRYHLKDFAVTFEPVPFVLHLNVPFLHPVGECNIKNEKTGEELIMDWHNNGEHRYFLVRRFPRGDDQGAE